MILCNPFTGQVINSFFSECERDDEGRCLPKARRSTEDLKKGGRALVNPTPGDLIALIKQGKEIRGLRTSTGDLYTWDASKATHEDVIDELRDWDNTSRFHIEQDSRDPDSRAHRYAHMVRMGMKLGDPVKEFPKTTVHYGSNREDLDPTVMDMIKELNESERASLEEALKRRGL